MRDGEARAAPSAATLGARRRSSSSASSRPTATFGNGVEFFPDIEPDFGLVQVRARGNLSIQEKDSLVRQVEERLLGMPEIETVYARAGEGQRGLAGGDRGYGRHRAVRVRRLEGAAQGERRSSTRSARRRRTSPASSSR